MFWRGLMIDTVRHMPSVSYLKKTIDTMEGFGLNKLHLHLSDDQGFRFESKKFPKLNTIASFRNETVIEKNFPTPWSPGVEYKGDEVVYGGFYTQDELRGLVVYAKTKNVDIIPEIDIPGHMTAILAAYPEYAALNSPAGVATYWGVFPYVLDDSPEAVTFLKELFDELCDVFDSRYVHLGADEVDFSHYQNNFFIPEYIITELIKYLNNKGKKVILWDEAHEIALKTNSIIMNWRDMKIGVDQVQKGGQVIFCPNEYFYFDYYQNKPEIEPLAIGGYLPVEKVMSFSFEERFYEKNKKNILGLQSNLWTEYTKTEEQMDYMLQPRLTAFSVVCKKYS